VVLVPEGGDEVQHIKSGLMEIADAFIVNKADRADADVFANNLKKIIGQKKDGQPPVFKTTALQGTGIAQVAGFIKTSMQVKNPRRQLLLTEKAYKLLAHKLTHHIDKKKLQQDVTDALNYRDFNLYSFVDSYL
jgi:LAO/AO transport system kinase